MIMHAGTGACQLIEWWITWSKITTAMLSKLVQTSQRKRTATQEKLRHKFGGAIRFPRHMRQT
jgi:hypothetical protein